jgi:diguanylate cyclase (GGDEF)-like protein
MRRFSLSVLLVAICLLPVGIGSGTSAHSHAVAALDGALANTAAAQAQVLEDYFSRARSIDLLTANNPAFGDFYALPGDRAAKIRAGGPVLDKTNRALGYLEELFPDSIGEACFIDRNGPENARMVRGVRATLKDLSPDESGAPFFAPTFALRQGEVYQARPYVSPDTKEWVISNSTLLPTPDRSKQAIVHFEVTIESFRKVAASLTNRFDIVVVDARTGQVVLDSRKPQQVGAPLGSPDDRRFQPVTQAGTSQGSSSVIDRPLAFQRLQRQVHNANDWYVLATARAPVGPLYGVSGWSIALVAVALALLVFAAVSFLAQHRLLVATSMTDALTGIPNRRQLKADLDQGLKQATPARPVLLMLFDLNGFKGYNDSFGHPAGDALLIRLAKALEQAMTEHGGCAYRLGGDEFCVLASVEPDNTTPIVVAASQALSEHGGGFSITASYGAILLPQESQDVVEAMRLVDQRMYAQKTSARAPPTARAATCCCGPSPNATPSWPNATPPWPAWPRRSGSGWACPMRSRPGCGRQPSCTTSASWPSLRTSFTRGDPWSPGSGRSCAATPSLASGSSARPRPWPPRPCWSTRPMSASMGRATPTGWPASRSLSERGSSPSVMPSPP